MDAPVGATTPSRSLLERWAPITGTIFVALFVATLLLAGAKLDPGEKTPEISRHFATNDYRNASIVALLLLLLSGAFFLWFLADLSATARAISGGMLAFLIPISGVVFITSLIAGLATWVTPLFNVGHSQLAGADPTQTAASYVLLTSVGFTLLTLAAVAGAILMGASAINAYRGRLIPRWLALTAVVLAVVAGIGGIIFLIPGVLILLWVLVASIRRTMLAARGALPTAN